MKRSMLALAALGVAFLPVAATAAEPESCRAVRMSDLGWTDIALTNTSAAVVLQALGYQPQQTLLALNVTYEMLKDKQLDIFLGNWRPVQDEQFKSYFDDKSVEPLATNLEGAKFTLAVPKYVADAGVKSYDDLAAHADRFSKTIYGIEPGSNQPLLDMIAAGRHGLSDWNVVESSETAMLMQVAKDAKADNWVVFLGWEPHPMNMTYQLTYLSGGDVEYGPNFGGATVRTIARGGYAAECPNAAKFFANLVFDLKFENVGMDLISNQGKSAEEAAKAMIAKHPEKLEAWLAGVTTFDGAEALPVVRSALGL